MPNLTQEEIDEIYRDNHTTVWWLVCKTAGRDIADKAYERGLENGKLIGQESGSLDQVD